MIDPDRRTVLRGVGTVGAVALAGCVDDSPDVAGEGGPGDDESGDGDGTETDDGTVRVDVRSVDAPSWAERGDPFTLSIRLENTGTAPGTYQDALVDQARGTEIAPIDVDVPAGETVRWESPPIVREQIPFSGRIDLGGASGEWSAVVDIVERLSLGEQYSYEDGVELRFDALVLKPDYEYEVGTGRERIEAPAGETFLFVYVTVDAPRDRLRALPARAAVGVDVDGERVGPTSPRFYPADEPLAGGTSHSRISLDDVADGLAAYDPAVIEETETVPPSERTLGDRDPIQLGQSAWVMLVVPDAFSLRDGQVLLSR